MKSLAVFLAGPLHAFTYKGVDVERDDFTQIDCAPHRNGYCSRDIRHVCGDDGFTRNHPCQLLSEYCMGNRNLRFAYWGKCEKKKKCPKFCKRDYRPVCGNDNKTYSNLCVLEVEACKRPKGQEKLKKVSEGECMANDAVVINEEEEEEEEEEIECNVNCGRIYAPVCGSDGIEYPSECVLNAKNCVENLDIRVVPCPTEAPCPKFCERTYFPVCGSNGQTYGNDCSLRDAACRNDPEMPPITKEADCACDDEECMRIAKEAQEIEYEDEESDMGRRDECSTACPMIYMPICGSDGLTYDNDCGLEVKNCQEQTNTKVIHAGKCRACPKGCTREWRPVCANTGTTYSNECVLNEAWCLDPTQDLGKVHDGECMQNEANIGGSEETDEAKEDDYDPLCAEYMSRKCSQFTKKSYCGNNGTLYYNLCQFRKAKCQIAGLELAKNARKCENNIGRHSLLSRVGDFRAFG